jgi:hypothetical protein
MNCRQVAEGEIVEKYLTGRLESSVQDDFEVHVLECRECLALLETCETARSALAAKGEPAMAAERRPWGWFTPRRIVVAGALAALIVIALLAAMRSGLVRWRRPTPTQAQSPAEGTPNPSGIAASYPEIAALSLDQQQRIRDVIKTGNMSYSPDLKDLSGRPGTLRSEAGQGDRFAVLGPAGEVVADPEPLFRWQPLAGAKSYSVSIYDAGLNPVQKSPPLKTTQWRANRPLRRDQIFQWQVTATMRDGTQIIAPDASSPVAKFRVLGEAKATELEQFRKAHPEAHLLLGILNAEAGLLETSQNELSQVPESSRDYQLAQQLLRSLQEKR